MASLEPRAPAATPRQPRYHHGDLRSALLRAGAVLLERVGVERFTLRECARLAGVSHAAPAHHFGDVSGLLSEMAAEGFERQAQLMQRYRAAAGADPFAQLKATGMAYIDFAIANPSQFRLMFSGERLSRSAPRLQAAAGASFAQLQTTLRAFLVERGAPLDDEALKLSLAHATVHGFVLLLLEGYLTAQHGTTEPADAAALSSALLDRLRVALES